MKGIDLTFWLYLFLALITSYGFFLFVWWWIKKRGASVIYGYITFLLLGLSIRSWIDLYARYLYASDVDKFYIYMKCWIWPCRLLLTLVFSFAIIGHMSYRAFFQGKLVEHYINPLHIYCKLIDWIHLSKKVSRYLSIKYESFYNYIHKSLID